MTYYIDNPEINKQVIDGIKIISPKAFLGKKIDESDNIIVLCELNIDKNGHSVDRSEFYGIKFVQDLRRKKYKNKVLFVSFLPLGYFRDTKSIYLDLLQFAGHNFLQLPAKPEDYTCSLSQIEVLSELSLYDLIHHFCGIREIFDEKIHSINSTFLNPAANIESLKIKSKEILDSLYKELGKENAVNDTFFNSVSTGKELLEKLKTTVYSETGETYDINTSVEPEWPWKILWLDDEDNSTTLLCQELRQRLGSENKILCCKTYKEAEIAWEKDKAYGEIAVVLCDYRLKDSNGIISPKQGYDFIEYIANDFRFCGKIVYSGLKRKFLIESFRHYGIMVNAYSKIDFNPDKEKDVKYLVDEIVRIGDESWITANNSPTAEEWKAIAPTYYKFKSGFEYYNFEKSISRQAKQNINLFSNLFNNRTSEYELTKLTFHDKFRLRTGNWPSKDNEKIPALKEVLYARRLLIGLYAFMKSSENKNNNLRIENYLNYIKLVVNNSKNNFKNGFGPISFTNWSDLSKNNTIKQVTGANAVNLERSWPFGLLPEEYAWLQFDMEYLDNANDEIKNFLKIFNKIKSSFDLIYPIIIGKLDGEGSLPIEKIEKGGIKKSTQAKKKPKNKKNDESEHQNKLISKRVYFDDNNTPTLRSVDEIKQLLQYLYKEIDVSNKEDFKLFIDLWRKVLHIVSSKSILYGDIKSLRTYLLDMKPKCNNEKLKSIYQESGYETNKNFTIEDEYILMYNPFEIYFPRVERIKPTFHENKKALFNLFELALNNKTDSTWTNNQGKGSSYIEVFSHIDEHKTLSDNYERRKAIFKSIIIYKKNVNNSLNTYYNEINIDPVKLRSSNAIDDEEDYNIYLFSEKILDKLKLFIINWDHDFPGNTNISKSLNKSLNRESLPINPIYKSKNYIIVLQKSNFDSIPLFDTIESTDPITNEKKRETKINGMKEKYIINHDENISTNENLVIFSWD